MYLWSRPKIGEVITTNNAVSVSWTSYGAATDGVQAASSLMDAFTNIAVVSVPANRLVRTNFSEPTPVATKTRFYSDWRNQVTGFGGRIAIMLSAL